MGDTKTEVIAKLIGQFKSTRYIFAISVISGILLFSPKNIVNNLGVSLFIQKYRVWVGIAFLVSCGFWIADIGVVLLKKQKSKTKLKAKINQREEKVKSLTHEEKEILSYYIDNQTRTQLLPFDSGVVTELVYYNIIYRSSSIIDMNFELAYNIQPWAWDYLNKHPELLETQTNCDIWGL